MFLGGSVDVRVGVEDKWDLRGVVGAELGVGLGIGEGGVEVVAPCRNADARCCVGPKGCWL